MDEINVDGLENAVNFQSFETQDKKRILHLVRTKIAQGEFDESKLTLYDRVESVALMYRAQLAAFTDVLTRQQFEICESAERDYKGRIAVLTVNGTLGIFGSLRNGTRSTHMSRIYSPDLNYDRSRVRLECDPSIGHPLVVYVCSENKLRMHSPLRAVAINPRQGDGDELEDAVKIASAIGMDTAYYLLQGLPKPVKVEMN